MRPRAGVGGAVIALWLAAGCAEPTRPRFGPDPMGVDTFPPTILFLAPSPADSIWADGDDILVQVRVSDNTPLLSVAAGVLGALTFGFPTTFPNDTVAEIGYPIAVPAGTTGRIVLRIVALDSLSNSGTADRAFVIQ